MRWPHQRNAKIRENLAVLTKENTVGMNNLHSAVCGKSQEKYKAGSVVNTTHTHPLQEGSRMTVVDFAV